MSRTLVFGWDGVPYSLFKEAVEYDITPNLGDLYSVAASGPLEAVLPIVTPANWYSAFTGVYPWRHGITNFVVVDRRYGLRYMDIRLLKSEAIWDWIGGLGKRGVYVNIPVSTPAPEVSGVWVSDEEVYRDPTPHHVYPDELLDTVKRYGYKVGYPFLYMSPERLYRDILRVEKGKLDATSKLLDDVDWDIAVFIARSPDYLLHLFYGIEGYRDYIYGCLKMLDDWLGIVMSRHELSNVIIFSDHGHMVKPRFINLPGALEKGGFLVRRRSGRVRVRYMRRSRLVRWVWNNLPRGVRQYISRVILDKVVEIDSPAREMVSGIDWGRTKVFPNVNVGGLKINLKGVFSEGVVELSEASTLADEVRRFLLNLSDDEGPIFKDIIVNISEDPLQPDIYLEPRDDLWFKGAPTDDVIVENKALNMDPSSPLDVAGDKISYHIRTGFYLLHGKPFKKSVGVKLEMVDMAPTILAAMGVPIPGGLDGGVRKDILEIDVVDTIKELHAKESFRRRLGKKAKGVRRRLGR